MTSRCPSCGGTSVVKDSRQKEGTTRRHRECYRCGTRWVTVEMIEAEYEDLRGRRSRHKAAGHASVAARRGFHVPPERLAEYRYLTRTKHMRAKEAAVAMGLIESSEP